MRKPFLCLLFTVLLCLGRAHECWLEPQHFQLKPGQQVDIHIREGTDFESKDWPGGHENVEKFKIYLPGVEDDFEDLVSDSTGDSLNLQFMDEGTIMMAMLSKNRTNFLPAEKFNQFLQDEELGNVIEWRKENGESDSAATEIYQQNVKTLLQVGGKKTENYRKKTPLPLDIIPLNHPYELKKGQEFQLKVLFNNQPLPHHLVKIRHKTNGKVEQSKLLTNDQGDLKIPVVLAGNWLASCITMVRYDSTDGARFWRSYRSSLTWGY